MSVTNLGFADAVEEWCKQVEVDIRQVVEESTIYAVRLAQKIGASSAYPAGMGGNMPVDTGWLLASVRVSTVSMPTIDPNSYPPESAMPGWGLHLIPYQEEQVFAAIRAAATGSTIYVGWTAAYAAYQEYGAGGRSGRLFVTRTAQRWPQIVAAVTASIERGMAIPKAAE